MVDSRDVVLSSLDEVFGMLEPSWSLGSPSDIECPAASDPSSTIVQKHKRERKDGKSRSSALKSVESESASHVFLVCRHGVDYGQVSVQ